MLMKMFKIMTTVLSGTLLLAGLTFSQNRDIRWQPELTEDWTPVEDSVSTTGHFAEPPSDAIILFDGSDLSEWESAPGYFTSMGSVPEYIEELQKEYDPAPWNIEDGAMVARPGTGGIKSKKNFGDMHLHIEWRTPEVIEGEGQGRGNSGVFLQGLYEIQVLDSWQNPTYSNGQAGSIYKQKAPMVNASRPPGEWQSYDIFFEAPYFDESGKVVKPGQVTVLHNGVLIHHKVELQGPTVYIGQPHYKEHPDKLPISLQDHSNPVSFRNIWVREL